MTYETPLVKLYHIISLKFTEKLENLLSPRGLRMMPPPGLQIIALLSPLTSRLPKLTVSCH